MTGLASFSDWVLAALPRLFLYPGGLWLLAALLLLRAAVGGARAVRPSALARDFAAADLLALALGWVTVALLPLPRAVDLPLPADRLVLVSLPLLSLALRRDGKHRSLWTALGISLALLAPLAGENALLVRGTEWSATSVLAMLAVAVGLFALAKDAARDLASAARWLAWLGLAVAPLLDWGAAQFGGIFWVSAIYAVATAGIGFASRYLPGFRDSAATPYAVWLLAGAALLSALAGW